jgi:hypothetical protein
MCGKTARTNVSLGVSDMTRIRKIIIACAVFATILVGLWLRDVISDRRNELEIMKPITLLKKAPQDYPKENKEAGKIQIGEKTKVLRMGYGKDFRAWKVRGSMGQEGWFIEDNNNIKVK